MLRRVFVLAAICCLLTLGAVSQASASYVEETVTIDILDIFDTNNDGAISFGDSTADGYKHAENVTKYFSLAALDGLTELVGSTATITISYKDYDPSSMDDDAYVKFNGTKLGDLPDHDNYTKSWSISLSKLNFGGSNNATMHTAYYDEWYGDHYENYTVTNWTLAYTTQTWVEDPAPEVPVPAAVWMLGSGLLGLTGIRRRKK